MGDNDCDLFAVVRSCSSAGAVKNSAAAVAAATEAGNNHFTKNENSLLSCLASLTFQEEENAAFSFPDLSQSRESGYLEDILKLFLACPDPTNTSVGIRSAMAPPTSIITPNFVFGQSSGYQEQPPPPPPPPPPQQVLLLPSPLAAGLPLRNMAPRSRKRRIQQTKTICHVSEDNLSSDSWAWRKYGQKPIKGSPFPRNYYRCSTSKVCPARKQVERSNSSDNNDVVFIVTYTAEHNHPRPTYRNSLAGSTRNKLPLTTTTQMAAASATTASGSSPRSADTTQLSASEDAANASVHINASDNNEGEVKTAPEGESDENDLLNIPDDMHVDDEDLFKGLEDLVIGGTTVTALCSQY